MVPVVFLTWFLNNSIAGISYLLPFGLIWVLVVIEIAINSRKINKKLIKVYRVTVVFFFLCHASLLSHLSITARHSFLQVKRLPRRRRKVPGVVARGGGVCLHSISSRGRGAGRMFRVAPGERTGSEKSESICRPVCALKVRNVVTCRKH